MPAIHIPKRTYTVRPHRVKLNRKHTLYRGLKFAAVGNLFGVDEYSNSVPSDYGGTLVNSPVWGIDTLLSRPVLYFDETLSQRVSLSPTLSVGANHTVSLWMYDEGSTGSYSALISQDGSNAIFYRGVNGADQYSLNYYFAGGGHTTVENVVTPQTWHHVLAVCRGGNGSMYVDGVEVSLEAPVTGHPGYGFVQVGNDTSNEEFDGYISDLFIYDRPVVSDEIAMLSNLGDLTYKGFVVGLEHDYVHAGQQVDVQSTIFRSRLIRGGV